MRLEHVRRILKRVPWLYGGSQAPEFAHLEHGSSFTNEDIAHVAAFIDTLRVAAVASACERLRFHRHPGRL